MSRLRILLALCIGGAVLFLVTNASNPGFRTAITNKGLNYVREVGIPILTNELSKQTIPDINGKASSPIGKIDYDMSSIHTSNFEIPSSSLSIAEGKGISVSASGASVKLDAKWHYKMESWPHVSDSGSCEVKVSSVSLSFVVTVGADSQGHAALSAGDCHCDIGHVDITFHGGASWLYNLFTSSIEGVLKSSLADQVCSAGTKAIDDQGSKALESLPVTVVLDKYAEVDYHLLSSPTYTNSYMETNHKQATADVQEQWRMNIDYQREVEDSYHQGEFFLRLHPTEAPFPVPSIPSVQSPDNMMYLWLTDYMINTAGLVYQESGELHFVITPSMVPPSVQKLFALNTTTFKSYIPELYNKCPDCPMTLRLNNSAPTTVKIAPSGISGTLPGTVEVNVTRLKDNSTSEAFVLQALVHFSATVKASENNSRAIISGTAKYLSTDLTVISSNIGKFPVSGLEEAMNTLCTLAVIPYINKYTEAGIPLPVVDGASLVNPVIQLGEDYVEIATDFSYKPEFLGKPDDSNAAVHARFIN